MSVWQDVWEFTLERLDQAWSDLTDEQLRWRPHSNAHSTYEILVHLAGAHHYWWKRLSAQEAPGDEYSERLDDAVRAGFLRDGEVPFAEKELSIPLVRRLLSESADKLRPILSNPTAEQLAMPIESPIGPMIDGKGGLIRIVQHSAYHTGQIWLMRMDPRFPKA